MMTSIGGNRARGSREQTQSQTQHKQRPQATAEQIRLAQMISDHNDADFEEKVKQLIDITGKDQDESMIALHDCNGDVNRAINVLLEGSPDTDSWEMVGKKKGVSGQKETNQAEAAEEGKENREKGGEKDVARRRGGAPRKGRGASRGREFRGQENGLDGSKAGIAGRGAERGRRGRGRGRGTMGASGRRGGRFSAQGMGTFNPADYAEPAQTEENYGGGSTWNNTGSVELEEGARLEYSAGEGTTYPPKFDSNPGVWRTATEEWGAEDWNEDLSETKIFTASTVASRPVPQENVTITKGQRIDLAVLLGKTPPSSSSETANPPMEATQPSSLSQSMVFSNSKQGVPLSQTSSGTPYTQHGMVSMLNKGFVDVGDSKGANTGTTGSQFLEQYKTAQALAQLAAQHSQTGTPNTTPSSWDTNGTSLGQYDMKTQPDSAVHTPFTKRQPYQSATSTTSMLDVFLQDKGLPPSSAVPSSSSLPQQTPPSPHVVPPPASALPKMATVPSLGQQVSPSSSDAQSPLPLQQHKLKQQKKRTSITTKIPAMAVEMPGSSDISGLNLQFGALQFGSEPVLPEYESAPTTTTPVNQVQNNLYTSSGSESTPALSNSSQMDMYDQRTPQTRRYPPSVSSSPQKDMQPKNGFTSIQAPQSVEAAAGSAVSVKPVSDSVAQPSVSSMGALTDSPASLLTSSNQTSLSALGHSEDLPPSTIPPPQHNNSHPSQQNSLATSSVRTSNSSLLHPSVDDSSLHSSSFPSSVSAVQSSAVPSSSSSVPAAQVSLGGPQASSMGSATVSAPSGLGPVSSLTMGLNNASMGAPAVAPATVSVSTTGSSIPSASSSSTRSSAASSGKAPPNLPPGVPSLLPNPYIMAPGLLHAYPPQVYGYDDLQMLQTRIPLDYYSIPFATPTTALTGREGSLTNNPYSGDLSKFGRGDASSPAPATTLAQTQQNQSQTHHTTQQTFLNPALPPGYSYTSLPYYTGMPGLPNTFQYGPAVFPVAPTSSKQHGVNVGVNASAAPFQQASGYGSHGYSTGVSVTSSNTGVPDISGSVYTKTQSFEKQGFHAGTPATSFSLPSALGSGGPINPPAAAGYAPAPFMHILAPHQQPHSQILHHHIRDPFFDAMTHDEDEDDDEEGFLYDRFHGERQDPFDDTWRFGFSFGPNGTRFQEPPAFGHILKEMEEIFSQLGHWEGQTESGVSMLPPPEYRAEQGNGRSSRNPLRDFMLKYPDSDSQGPPCSPEPGYDRRPSSEFPAHPSSPFRGLNPFSKFDDIWKKGPQRAPEEERKEDRDLDSAVSSGGLDEVLAPSAGQTPNLPRSRSFFQSVTVTKVVKPDGSVEERRTVRDSQGKEETTITVSGGPDSMEGPGTRPAPIEPGGQQPFPDMRDDNSLFSRFFRGGA